MKVHIYILFLFSIITQGLFAQNFDYNWIIGENPLSRIYTLMNFQNMVPGISTKSSYSIPFDDCNVTMSDKNGKLIFFSNGLQISNRLYKIMEGGERINPSDYLDGFLETGATANILIAFPSLDDQNKFQLIHLDRYILSSTTKPKIYAKKIFSSIVNMDANNGLGRVDSANTVLMENEFSSGLLTATKHGNGRDWWIPVLGTDTNIIFIFKYDLNGVRFSHSQYIGSNLDRIFGQASFSQDGKMYARVNANIRHLPSFIDIFDFDRCSGIFSNFKKIILEESMDTLRVSGLSISPNSRFLYVSYQKQIFQYDLWASDIATSKDTIAVYDGFTDPASSNFPTYFYKMQMGPDGKIYINTGNYATTYLHVIDQPDQKGKACNVLQHKIKLTASNGFTMPNFPNYRLGPLKGSPCDSIVANKEIAAADYHIKVFPNPATTELKIDITLPNYDPQSPTEIRLISAAGAIVKTYTMPDFAYLATLDISDVDSGFYEVQLRQRGKTMAVEKVVVVR